MSELAGEGAGGGGGSRGPGTGQRLGVGSRTACLRPPRPPAHPLTTTPTPLSTTPLTIHPSPPHHPPPPPTPHLRSMMLSESDALALVRRAPPPLSFHWDYRWMEYPGGGRVVQHPNCQAVQTYRGHVVMSTLIRCATRPPLLLLLLLLRVGAGTCRVREGVCSRKRANDFTIACPLPPAAPCLRTAVPTGHQPPPRGSALSTAGPTTVACTFTVRCQGQPGGTAVGCMGWLVWFYLVTFFLSSRTFSLPRPSFCLPPTHSPPQPHVHTRCLLQTRSRRCRWGCWAGTTESACATAPGTRTCPCSPPVRHAAASARLGLPVVSTCMLTRIIRRRLSRSPSIRTLLHLWRETPALIPSPCDSHPTPPATLPHPTPAASFDGSVALWEPEVPGDLEAAADEAAALAEQRQPGSAKLVEKRAPAKGLQYERRPHQAHHFACRRAGGTAH